jgi:hypothetical protein
MFAPHEVPGTGGSRLVRVFHPRPLARREPDGTGERVSGPGWLQRARPGRAGSARTVVGRGMPEVHVCAAAGRARARPAVRRDCGAQSSRRVACRGAEAARAAVFALATGTSSGQGHALDLRKIFLHTPHVFPFRLGSPVFLGFSRQDGDASRSFSIRRGENEEHVILEKSGAFRYGIQDQFGIRPGVRTNVARGPRSAGIPHEAVEAGTGCQATPGRRARSRVLPDGQASREAERGRAKHG